MYIYIVTEPQTHSETYLYNIKIYTRLTCAVAISFIREENKRQMEKKRKKSNQNNLNSEIKLSAGETFHVLYGYLILFLLRTGFFFK